MLGCVCAADVGKVQTVEKMPQHEVVDFAVKATAVKSAPHNVILMIGDGMSSEHVWAAWLCNGGKLNIEKLPVTGFSRTYSANCTVTDSAAGGTALACGEKTNNGMLGQAPDGRRLKSLAAHFASAPYNKKTGLVVTKSITDATPAAFYAHTESRKNTAVIASQLCESGFDVVVGGGFAAFSDSQMDKLVKNTERLQLPATWDCPYAPQRGGMLPEQTKAALEILQKSADGFFLMVEGSKIDSASHEADAYLAVAETLDFDRAVGEVLRWMQKNPDTLLVVTADHQTGGLTIHDGDRKTGRVKASFATTSHTGIAVPIYAAGVGAVDFSGVMDNTEIPAKILKIATEDTEK